MVSCKSIFVSKHGGPNVLVLKKHSIRDPFEGEVTIKVNKIGINFADLMGRMGLYPGSPSPPYVPGFEVSGSVEMVGSNKMENLLGTKVIGLSKIGGAYSTHINIPLNQLFEINNKWYEVAAAIPVNYLTAYFMLVHQSGLRRDEWVLIHGAGGGVGLASIQIAKIIGAKIIGTSSSWKHEKLKKIGVDYLIDYNNQKFKDEVLEITSGRGVDVVIDSLGGKALAQSYSSLAEFGRLVSYGFSRAVSGNKKNYLKILPEYFGAPTFNPSNLMMRNRGVFGFHLGYLTKRHDLVRRYGDLIMDWLNMGKISPIIDSTFKLKDAEDAHDYITKRKNFGKVLLSNE
tara:strand:- start:82932 stop:83960 length:1029 start_codon:yes stop_codon:yes gene_type:complete